jgi:pilus assembly protein Flp/PilA
MVPESQTGAFWSIAMKARTVTRLAESLLRDESGQDLIEYALIAALIAVAAIAALKGLNNKINNEFNAIGNSL